MMQEELTLTGATLTSDGPNGGAGGGASSSLMSTSDVEMVAQNTATDALAAKTSSDTTNHQEQCSHHHDHSHGHSHSHHQGQHHHDNSHMAPRIVGTPQETLEKILLGSTVEQNRALATLIRLGTYNAFEAVAQELEKQQKLQPVLVALGEDGHSLLHWAAKRVDDVRFLSFLCDQAMQNNNAELLNIASKDGAAGMRPLHWACTEGSIPHAALLLKSGAMMEAVDGSGCTPLLIAAQYGHAEMVAFLHQRGASLDAVDDAMDSALHWASYKGSMPVCGLLIHQGLVSEIDNPDSFGQTPLHLAALRGNTSVVRYLLQECPNHATIQHLLQLKDKKGKTPLDLAISKKRPTVEAVLREAMELHVGSNQHYCWRLVQSQCRQLCSLHSWKVWFGCHAGGADEVDEAPKLPFYITVFHMALAALWYPLVFTPLTVGKGLLWDKYGLHLFTIVNMTIMWIMFWKTWRSDPGLLNDDNPTTARLKRQYEQTLEQYADESYTASHTSTSHPETQLCHSCHIARPLRSKHCRVSRRCVLMFDHFCPFVGNTIGLYNYKWFYLFLLSMFFAFCGFFTTWIIYMHRLEHFSWSIFFGGLYMVIFLFMDLGLLIYHTQLCLTNLTTNEHQNLARYKYLHNERGMYRNPFFKGKLANFLERFATPSEACYTLPPEQASLVTRDLHVEDMDGDIV